MDTLPQEIVGNIIRYLGPGEVNNLLHTCRTLRETILRHFRVVTVRDLYLILIYVKPVNNCNRCKKETHCVTGLDLVYKEYYCPECAIKSHRCCNSVCTGRPWATHITGSCYRRVVHNYRDVKRYVDEILGPLYDF